MPTDFEELVVNAARRSQKNYEQLSGGSWLGHAPEHFLQNEVARAIGQKGYLVYIDASHGKVQKDSEEGPRRGPPRKDRGQRFDISIWQKSGPERLKYAIEIKRAWTFEPVRRDCGKVRAALKRAYGPKTGYVLVYSDVKRAAKLLTNSFSKWANELVPHWRLAHSFATKPHDSDWAWGIALLRFDRD